MITPTFIYMNEIDIHFQQALVRSIVWGIIQPNRVVHYLDMTLFVVFLSGVKNLAPVSPLLTAVHFSGSFVRNLMKGWREWRG